MLVCAVSVFIIIIIIIVVVVVDGGCTEVKALWYKSVGPLFDPKWYNWNFFFEINLPIALCPRSRLRI